uniref:Uncharacterized protein n=1 Tax=Anguilla anguilla TaxID=7936 RepID=A0A0E9PME4_ANGAN
MSDILVHKVQSNLSRAFIAPPQANEAVKSRCQIILQTRRLFQS